MFFTRFFPKIVAIKREWGDAPRISKRIPFLNRLIQPTLLDLLRQLGLTGLVFPLGARGICNINQLDRLTLDMLKPSYRSKLAKLICFVKSPWFKTYQTGTNTMGVIHAFELQVNQNMTKAWRYSQDGRHVPSPMFGQAAKGEGLPSIHRPKSERGAQKSVCSVRLRQTPVPIQYGRKVLMSFGINNYKDWPQLHNAVSDANSIQSHFLNQLGFDVSQSKTNEDVTKEAIMRFFQETAPRCCGPNDLLVVSFHGHGCSKAFQGRSSGFLVPVNAPSSPGPYDLISMDEIAGWLRYTSARHVLLLVDACFSGLMATRGPRKSISTRHPELQRRYIRYHLNHRARVVINAGHSYQAVSDGGWQGHSIFTGAILSSDVLKRSTASIYEFFQSIHDTVVNSGHSSQIPTLGKLPGDEGGDIFLGLKEQGTNDSIVEDNKDSDNVVNHRGRET